MPCSCCASAPRVSDDALSMPSLSRMIARDGLRPSRLRSGIVASASKNAVLPYGFTFASARVMSRGFSVNGDDFDAPATPRKRRARSRRRDGDAPMSAPIAAHAASIFPASAIEPEPSSRIVNDTGAFCDFSNMSLRTGAPSTVRFDLGVAQVGDRTPVIAEDRERDHHVADGDRSPTSCATTLCASARQRERTSAAQASTRLMRIMNK